MSTTDLLLDQHKTPIAILFDKINIKNNTSLNYLDFDLGMPEAIEVYGSDANTKVKVIPKTASPFYKTQDIFYKRLNLADILSNREGQIVPGNAATLYELIPKINSVFGINLLVEDIYNTSIAPYNASSVLGTVSVTVKAKPDSFLFFGSYSLPLGPKAQALTLGSGDVSYFVHTKGYQSSEYSKMLTCINTSGAADTAFSFLRNATNVNTVLIDRVIQKSTGELVLNGNFVVTVKLGQSPVAVVTICQSMTLRVDGSIESIAQMPLFNANPDTRYYDSPKVAFKYFIAPDAPQGKAVARYLQNGLQDLSYASDSIKYTPTLLSVCASGKVYCVSPVFVAPLSFNNSVASKQIRIDRINSDGSLDAAFNPIVISANGNELPLPVSQILPVAGNGFWMLLSPLYGVSTTSVSPVVNGVASVSADTTEAYSWNPLFRISENGTVSQTFSKTLKYFLDKSIFQYPGSNLEVGDKTIIADEASVTFFSHRSNPITGYDFRQPIVFDNHAFMKYLSGSEYEDLYRWVVAKDILQEPSGSFLSYGKLRARLIDGTYGPINLCIARYKKSGAVDKLIYTQPSVTTLGEPLVLADVLPYKKLTTNASAIPQIAIPGIAIPGTGS